MQASSGRTHLRHRTPARSSRVTSLKFSEHGDAWAHGVPRDGATGVKSAPCPGGAHTHEASQSLPLGGAGLGCCELAMYIIQQGDSRWCRGLERERMGEERGGPSAAAAAARCRRATAADCRLQGVLELFYLHWTLISDRAGSVLQFPPALPARSALWDHQETEQGIHVWTFPSSVDPHHCPLLLTQLCCLPLGKSKTGGLGRGKMAVAAAAAAVESAQHKPVDLITVNAAAP